MLARSKLRFPVSLSLATEKDAHVIFLFAASFSPCPSCSGRCCERVCGLSGFLFKAPRLEFYSFVVEEGVLCVCWRFRRIIHEVQEHGWFPTIWKDKDVSFKEKLVWKVVCYGILWTVKCFVRLICEISWNTSRILSSGVLVEQKSVTLLMHSKQMVLKNTYLPRLRWNWMSLSLVYNMLLIIDD